MEKLTALLTLAPRPRIGVKVILSNDRITRITLFRAPHFLLDCPSEQLRNALVPWLLQYARGERWIPFPLFSSSFIDPNSLPKTPFSQKTALHLQSIPPGEIMSYQEVATAIDHAGAARAVGSVCSSNLFPLFIPCHRVISSSGQLGRFTPDPRLKQELLEFEGAKFN